ncbi:unnamed protein product [Ambrosiozyma monospora]|uniref:Unnamed protein product n=1 Tax=Ambrosiozyma monospora TaxID=43982 RepID=A0A9W6WCR1_AMBMO|nr:unnamed protein product [Ambrosiozyma monospora]
MERAEEEGTCDVHSKQLVQKKDNVVNIDSHLMQKKADVVMVESPVNQADNANHEPQVSQHHENQKQSSKELVNEINSVKEKEGVCNMESNLEVRRSKVHQVIKNSQDDRKDSGEKTLQTDEHQLQQNGEAPVIEKPRVYGKPENVDECQAGVTVLISDSNVDVSVSDSHAAVNSHENGLGQICSTRGVGT